MLKTNDSPGGPLHISRAHNIFLRGLPKLNYQAYTIITILNHLLCANFSSKNTENYYSLQQRWHTPALGYAGRGIYCSLPLKPFKAVVSFSGTLCFPPIAIAGKIVFAFNLRNCIKAPIEPM